MAITRAALLTPVEGPEVSGTVVDAAGSKRLVGGRPWVYVDRVSQPTMTIYPPEGRNTGAAVVAFPGGGYNVLAIDLEGTEACDWLTARLPVPSDNPDTGLISRTARGISAARR